MSYEAERMLLGSWLQRASRLLEPATSRLAGISTRWVLFTLGASLAAYAVFLRCLHLLNTQNHYLLSPDSYFFHWLALKFMNGEARPIDAPPDAIWALQSGLAYPLAYISKGISSVFGLTNVESLDLASKVVPPVLGILLMALVYCTGKRIFDRRIALFAAFAWVIMLHPVFITAAGYIDRDAVSLLLISLGALSFYFARHWRINIGGREFGWLGAGLIVLLMEGLLYLQWHAIGAMLLLAVVIAYFAVRFLVRYAEGVEQELPLKTRLHTSLKDANWRAFGVVAGGNLLAAAVFISEAGEWLSFGQLMLSAGGQIDVSELAGLGLIDIISYGLLLVPLGLGLYLAWKKHEEGYIFVACWLLSLLVLSLFARRILVFAAPAVALLAGVGFSGMWDWARKGGYRELRLAGLAIFLPLMVLAAYIPVDSMGRDPIAAANQEWQEALAYMREEMPGDAVVMTRWTYGYWILAIGERKPFMDNGFYGYDPARMRDVALVHIAEDTSQAAALMEKHGTDYLVFWSRDLDYFSSIYRDAGISDAPDSLPANTLIVRSFGEDFTGDGVLEVKFRNSEVVIVELID
ncbi:MAG: hypothetical protein IBX68_04560 [Dehalococcoidia bacterium]|nr:hypothetical protein [Dehalococcoidia bacterium]